jgi:LmbE family N-acetylglucosaminyl deacetylase
MKTVLSIGAHPDDIEIGCGGTEILLKNQGYLIIHLVVTSGEQGSLNIPSDQLILKREKEALESGKLLGVSEVIFLRLPDGLTTFSLEAKIEMIQIIRRITPDIIFTHSKFDTFPDHQIIRSLTESAVTAAAGPWYPRAGMKPHRVKRIYGYEVWHPISSYQTSFDITTTMESKKAALRCHYSQTSEVDYLAAIEGLARYRGATSMKGKYAEVFEIVYSEEHL